MAPEQKHLSLPAQAIEEQLTRILASHEFAGAGMQKPEEVTSATNEWRAENDRLATFLEARCTLNETVQVECARLYRAYREWAEFTNCISPLGAANINAPFSSSVTLVRRPTSLETSKCSIAPGFLLHRSSGPATHKFWFLSS
jgi:phage/plasmid-associated DNA primase